MGQKWHGIFRFDDFRSAFAPFSNIAALMYGFAFAGLQRLGILREERLLADSVGSGGREFHIQRVQTHFRGPITLGHDGDIAAHIVHGQNTRHGFRIRVVYARDALSVNRGRHDGRDFHALNLGINSKLCRAIDFGRDVNARQGCPHQRVIFARF